MKSNAKTNGWIWVTMAGLAAAMVAPSLAVAGGLEQSRPSDSRPAAASTGSYLQGFPRLLGGNGWETTIVLMDLGSTPVSFQQSFRGNHGAAASFNVTVDANGTNLTTSALQGVIAANGSVSFTLRSNNASLLEAWSLVTFSGTQGQLGGYAILRHASGSSEFAVTVPLSNMQDYSVRVPFDNTAGFQTQLTLVNPASNMSAQVQLGYFNTQGQIILVDSITLNPGDQTTLSLPNTYPDLANQTGTISVLGNLTCLSVSALRDNPSSGAIAPVPVLNFTATTVVQ